MKSIVISYEEFETNQYGRVFAFTEGDGLVYDAYKQYLDIQTIEGGLVERVRRYVRRFLFNRQLAAVTRQAQARTAELRVAREAGQVDETKYDIGAFAWHEEVR